MSNDAVFKNAIYIGTINVPNAGEPSAKVWVIGESPGEEEERSLVPFTGPSGQLLRETLREVGFKESDIYFANLCNYRPYANKFELLEGSPQLEQSKTDLVRNLRQYHPVLVIGLGNRPMEFLTSTTGISKRRGTVEYCSISGVSSTKILSTFHPSYVLRDSSSYPAFVLDIKRAYVESQSKEIKRKERDYHINPSGTELYELYFDYKKQKKLTCDIETVKRNKKGEGGELLCIGFAKSPAHAVCFNAEDPEQLKLAIDLLEDESIEKVFHFGNGFDVPYFFEKFGIEVRGYRHDTYIGQNILNPELPKGLDFLVSVYTDEPAYKTDGRGEVPKDTKVWGKKTNKANLYIYNCKDCAYTYEVHEHQLTELESSGLKSLYEQVMDQTELALHISHSGVLVDSERRSIMRNSLLYQWAVLQFLTDGLVGMVSGGTMARINVRATPAKRKLFYEVLKLPKRYNRGPKGESILATDEDAIVSLITHCEGYIDKLKTDSARNEWKIKQTILRNVLAIVGIRQNLSNYILARLSPDGRLRSIYNCAGPETGRWAASRYIDGSGFNAQTFPRAVIKIFEHQEGAVINIDDLLKQSMEEDIPETEYEIVEELKQLSA